MRLHDRCAYMAHRARTPSVVEDIRESPWRPSDSVERFPGPRRARAHGLPTDTSDRARVASPFRSVFPNERVPKRPQMCRSTADDLKRVLDKPSRDPKDHPARIPEDAEPHPMSRAAARHAAASRARRPNRTAVLKCPHAVPGRFLPPMARGRQAAQACSNGTPQCRVARIALRGRRVRPGAARAARGRGKASGSRR